MLPLKCGPQRLALACLGVGFLLCPESARAEFSESGLLSAFENYSGPGTRDQLSGQLGFGRIAEDYFVNFALRLSFDRENWGVGFQIPLRIRVHDQDPKTVNEDYLGVLRREDWDEVSDYLKLFRYVYIGRRDKKGPFYIRLGELSNLSMGHGTMVHRYFNGVDASRWRGGINASVNVGPFGAETLIGDVADPYLLGLRLTVRPLQLAGVKGFFEERLVLGATLMTDTKAPFALRTDTQGALVLNKRNVPEVEVDRTLVVVGVDVGLELIETDLLSITPYIDFNAMSTVQDGFGLHIGVLSRFSLPLGIDNFLIEFRPEYRRVSGDYRGPYFDTVYEIERVQALSDDGGSGAPKLRALCGAAVGALDDACVGRPGRNGVLLEALAGLPEYIFLGGEFIDYDGEANGSLRVSLEVPALEFVRFAAFYYRVNIEGLNDLIEIDDRSAIVAQASIPFSSVFLLRLRWWRVWQAEETGGFESVDDWSVGLGFSVDL